MKLFFDGGCKPNPGKMEVAIVSSNGDLREHQRLHYGTNNEAEWLAFLWALEMAVGLGAHKGRVEIAGDSLLVINQAKGVWRCKQPHLLVYHQDFCRLRDQFTDLKLVHVLRDQNPAGQYIEAISG